MPGIDFIYMINLGERPEKYQRTMNALKPYGIYPYRFSAVNGWKLSFKAIDELGVRYQPGTPPGPIASVYRHVDGKEYMSFEIMQEEGTAYYCHSLSRGAIGCILSHLSVLQDAYDSGYQTIWVMEDDIRMVRDPHELSSLINTLDKLAPDWDVLFTDDETKGSDGSRVYCGGLRPRPNFQLQPLDHYLRRAWVNVDLFKLGLRFGTYSMIIRRSGIQKILQFFKTYKLFFPYDIDFCFVPDLQRYACSQDIVTTIAGGLSDNGNPTYEKP
ncbi:MAG: glycosyltransferase family 25 protein [Verrucomicrobiota bacterium]|nr:glycosyltransferase family 25 protein [Verrucomicrobiota bacterium]